MNSSQKQFSVTLINPSNKTQKTLKVAPNEFILDQSKQQGTDLPYCCGAGACTVCTAKLLEGTVEQTSQAIQFLGRAVVDAGYILPCAAFPTSDCKILTHQEDAIF